MDETIYVNCTLKERVKVWGRTIQTLCSFGGSEVHLHFTQNGITLRSHNSSFSTYTCFTFNTEFFSTFECNAKDEDNLKCKIPTKCILIPFRTVRFLTNSVSQCIIKYTKNADKLNICLVTRFRAKILYSLWLHSNDDINLLDCEYNTLPNIITAESKVFLGHLSNFLNYKASAGDIVLKINDNRVSLRSASRDIIKEEGQVYTEISLESLDFIEYNVQNECQLTFPIRDFRTFVSFVDTMKLPVSIRFKTANEPVMIMVVGLDGSYEGSLTLTSMPDAQENQRGAETGNISSISSINTSAIDVSMSTTMNEQEMHQKSSKKARRVMLTKRRPPPPPEASSIENNAKSTQERHVKAHCTNVKAGVVRNPPPPPVSPEISISQDLPSTSSRLHPPPELNSTHSLLKEGSNGLQSVDEVPIRVGESGLLTSELVRDPALSTSEIRSSTLHPALSPIVRKNPPVPELSPELRPKCHSTSENRMENQLKTNGQPGDKILHKQVSIPQSKILFPRAARPWSKQSSEDTDVILLSDSSDDSM